MTRCEKNALTTPPQMTRREKNALAKTAGQTVEGKTITEFPSLQIADRIADLALAGATESDICVILDINPVEFRKLYERDLLRAETVRNLTIVNFIVDEAKHNFDAAKYWTKTRMGWRETDQAQTQVPFNLHIHV